MSKVKARKVIYTGEAAIEQIRWGNNDDPRGLLEPGKEYELLEVELHTWHTKYILKEFPDKKFNSVHFKGGE
jgi:hypothetical protein